MVKALIFDLQGTLVENGVFPSPLKQVKYILRIDAPFSDFVMRFEKVFMTQTHASLKDAFAKVCEEFHLVPKDYLIDKLVGLWNKNKLLTKLYPDTLSSLEELKGKYKLILVANIDCFSKEVIERYKFKEYFDLIILSCDTGTLKNEKEFYNNIIDTYNLMPEDVVMIGDSIDSDMETAKAIGIKGILIDRRNRREYDPKVLELTDLQKYLE
jgi:HAD superfamily hydrolase (TIGR01549 family)